MTDASSGSVVRQKIGQAAAVAPPGPAHVLGQVAARVMHRAFALPLAVVSQSDRDISLAELPEVLEERALILQLDGPEGATGLLALGPALLGALIEAQMTGRIAGKPPAERRPTRTDAAMMTDLAADLVSGFADELATGLERTWVAGYRPGRWIEDPRPLPLLLDEGGLRGLRLTLDLGEDAQRRGDLLLLLPRPRAPDEDAVQDVPDDGWQASLADVVLAASVPVTAVLARISLPLDLLMSMRPGQLVTLPPDALARVTLECAPGRILLRGQLGRARAARALRLGEASPGDVIDPPWQARLFDPPMQGLLNERPLPPDVRGRSGQSGEARQMPDRRAAG